MLQILGPQRDQGFSPQANTSIASTHLIPEDMSPVVLSLCAIGQTTRADAVEAESRRILGWDGTQQVIETPIDSLS